MLHVQRALDDNNLRKHYISEVNKDDDADVDVWSNRELDRRIRSEMNILEESQDERHWTRNDSIGTAM